ncbi:MAG TPA: Mth938-like domain-containing protein [Burkholderiales bacterium]|nr:Mth938-like domain-containing protein [Burkholderiales bacterium]
MKLHLTTADGRNFFTAYGPGYVKVGNVRHERSIVVLPDRVIENWSAVSGEPLDETAVALLAKLGVEIVLLGTGESLAFPEPRVLRPLVEAGIGFEVMDTRAACRTYNILTAENRKVAAALIL